MCSCETSHRQESSLSLSLTAGRLISVAKYFGSMRAAARAFFFPAAYAHTHMNFARFLSPRDYKEGWFKVTRWLLFVYARLQKFPLSYIYTCFYLLLRAFFCFSPRGNDSAKNITVNYMRRCGSRSRARVEKSTLEYHEQWWILYRR